MKIATWNVNSIKVRLDRRSAWLKEAKPDVVACRKSNAWTRISPPSRSRRWAIIAPYTDRKPITASPSCPSGRWRMSRPRLPGGDGDDHSRYLEAVVTGEKGVLRRRLRSMPPTAIPSARRNSPTSWPGWSGCSAHAKELLAQRRAGGADGRLQHHSRRQGLLRSQGLGE